MTYSGQAEFCYHLSFKRIARKKKKRTEKRKAVYFIRERAHYEECRQKQRPLLTPPVVTAARNELIFPDIHFELPLISCM